jgi:hypothetical protein
MSLQGFVTESVKHTTVHFTGTLRNLLLGACLHYAIQREEYTHIPLIIIFPSIYAGYHSHRNKDLLLDWVIETKRKMKGGLL